MSAASVDDWRKPSSVIYAVDEPEFMAEFGRAMAEWGNVEHALSSLFAAVIQPKRRDHARAAFHNVVSFRDRLGMIDVTFEMALGPYQASDKASTVKEWSRLKDVLQKVSRSRNMLAHMHVWHGPSFGTFGWKDITQISVLPVTPEERKKLVVTTSRLRDYRGSFSSCAKRTRAFTEALDEILAAPPPPFE